MHRVASDIQKHLIDDSLCVSSLAMHSQAKESTTRMLGRRRWRARVLQALMGPSRGLGQRG